MNTQFKPSCQVGEAVKTDEQDAAWAILHTPMSEIELNQFCQDIERLFRINPMLNVEKWQALSPNRYYFAGQNISQKPPFDFELIMTVEQSPNNIQIHYEQGLKTRTTFVIEPVSSQQNATDPPQSKLIITDFYGGLPEAERAQQLHEVDKSISVWANDLQQYLLNWKKWSQYGLWRWYMRHIWQPMKPMGRRITYILFWMTVVELAFIFLGTALYYLEYTV